MLDGWLVVRRNICPIFHYKALYGISQYFVMDGWCYDRIFVRFLRYKPSHGISQYFAIFCYKTLYGISQYFCHGWMVVR